jgi:hypothetical protein
MLGCVEPFPPELEPVLRACVGGRTDGPLLRRRGVFEGRERPPLTFAKAGDVEAAHEAALLAAGRGLVQAEQDAKAVFREVLRRAGGVGPDHLSREFGALLRRFGPDPGVRSYDARAAVTTDMNRAGVPGLGLRYLTGHTTGDVLNDYVAMDPDGAMAGYFERILPLLGAVSSAARRLLISRRVDL